MCDIRKKWLTVIKHAIDSTLCSRSDTLYAENGAEVIPSDRSSAQCNEHLEIVSGVDMGEVQLSDLQYYPPPN